MIIFRDKDVSKAWAKAHHQGYTAKPLFVRFSNGVWSIHFESKPTVLIRKIVRDRKELFEGSLTTPWREVIIATSPYRASVMIKLFAMYRKAKKGRGYGAKNNVTYL